MDIEEHHTGFDGKYWQVHKFGGTSVADASCFTKVARIIEEQIGIDHDNIINHDVNAQQNAASTSTIDTNLAVVVSAMGGKPKVTDLLLKSVSAAASRNEQEVDASLQFIQEKHNACLEALFGNNNDSSVLLFKAEKSKIVDELKQVIARDITDIRDILKTVSLMKWQAKRISELVSGYGETWSAQILSALLSMRAKERFQLWNENNSDGNENSSSYSSHHYFRYIDARRIITIDEDAIKDGAVCWDISMDNMKNVYREESTATFGSSSSDNPNSNTSNGTMHFVITGYVASNTQAVATTLQRDGSDYSAAIMGRLLESILIAIWTDVDGVLSADPRRVPHAYVLPEVSFNEAMELAYFGAKVIHPKTMQPAIMGDPQIPIYIKNTFNSSFRGSRIFTSSTTHTDRDRCVCGFSSIDNMAMINVEGSGMVGVKGVARRLFGTLETIGVNVVLISQASSEHSITFATSRKQAEGAKVAIEDEFHKEIKQSHITSVDVVSPCSIIAAVGDGMHFTTGVAGRFFSALGGAKINILAISQGSNERNISAVVFEDESTRALRAVHEAFRLSNTVVRVGIVGMNEIGASLLKLLETQRNKWRETFEVELQVCAVLKDGMSSEILVRQKSRVRSKNDSLTVSMYNFVTGGSSLLGAPASSVSFQDSVANVAKLQPGGFDVISDFVYSEVCAHNIIFDCTADENIGKKHIEWLKRGIHIVTANNTALSGPKEIRDEIKNTERLKKTSYLREVTVGGGLPVISTLRALLNSGDQICRMDGILSVTMSYVMHRIAPPPGFSDCSRFDEISTQGAYRDDLSMSPSHEGMNSKSCSFSEAMREAVALGLTEEDPIKDVNNEYTARCLMVLARELGLDEKYDVSKIQSVSDSLVKKDVKSYGDIEADLDVLMTKRVSEAAANGNVPRHVSSIDVQTGEILIKMVDVPQNHLFATLQPSCECVRFFTQRHKTYPLIIQGPSAGPDSTASALLAELLNLMRKSEGSRPGEISRTNSSSFLIG